MTSPASLPFRSGGRAPQPPSVVVVSHVVPCDRSSCAARCGRPRRPRRARRRPARRRSRRRGRRRAARARRREATTTRSFRGSAARSAGVSGRVERRRASRLDALRTRSQPTRSSNRAVDGRGRLLALAVRKHEDDRGCRGAPRPRRAPSRRRSRAAAPSAQEERDVGADRRREVVQLSADSGSPLSSFASRSAARRVGAPAAQTGRDRDALVDPHLPAALASASPRRTP